MTTVTAIIPTLSNTIGLHHLLLQLSRVNLSAVIVDNGNAAVTQEMCKTLKATYLPQNTNLGFAKAINEGVQHLQSEWILILNDDVEGITKQLLDRLVEEATKNNWVAVTPVLKKPTGETENIGYTVLPIGKVKLNFDEDKATEKDLDGLTAACLLIKTRVFRELNGFDESFFAYLEDVDLFLRLKKAGYRFGVDIHESVVHQHLTTSKKAPKKKAWLDVVNWWRLVIKHPRKFITLSTLLAMLLERLKNMSGWIKQ